jgi:hypothetical protein
MTAKKQTYTGINIQAPIARMILEGIKTIETRTYPIPAAYRGQKMIVIETPGPKGKFKARMIGFVTFGASFEYLTEKAFYADSAKHCVTPDSPWHWVEGKRKFGWPVLEVKLWSEPKPKPKGSGIVYCTHITL